MSALVRMAESIKKTRKIIVKNQMKTQKYAFIE